MKKSLQHRWGRLLTALLLITTVFIIHSCRKDLTAKEADAVKAAEAFPVSAAQSWYGAHKVNLANKIKVNALNAYLSAAANFTPIWDSARTALDTNYYVVEVPAKYLKPLGFGVDSVGINVNGLTRLLVLKSKKYGSMSAVLMQIHGDAGVDLNNVHYMAVPATFSGQIFYATVQGLFMNGYFYKNGKVTLKSSPIASTKPAGPQVLMRDNQDCWLITIPHYIRNCVDYGSYVTCGGWDVEYEDQYVFCYPISSGDGGGGSGDTGVLPPPCQPGGGSGGGGGNGSVTTNTVHGKLVISQANTPDPGDGGDDGDTGTLPGCPAYVPVVTTVVDIVDSVQNPCLKKMVDSLMSKNIKGKIDSMIQSVFGGTKAPTLSFTDQLPMVVSTHDAEDLPLYNDVNHTTYIGSSIRLKVSTLSVSSQEFIAATIMHEALHAYLDSKGIDIGDAQHADMAKKYIDIMAADLMAMFPGLIKDNAYSLAWGGLEGTTLYSNPGTIYLPTYQQGINTLYRAHTDGNNHYFGHGC